MSPADLDVFTAWLLSVLACAVAVALVVWASVIFWRCIFAVLVELTREQPAPMPAHLEEEMMASTERFVQETWDHWSRLDEENRRAK